MCGGNGVDPIARLAEGQGELRGQFAQFVSSQTETNRLLTEFCTNHIPHMEAKLAELAGRVGTLFWAIGAFGSIVAGAIAMALFVI